MEYCTDALSEAPVSSSSPDMSLHSRADWPEATFLWKFLSKIELSASCDIVLSWMYFKPHKTNMMFKLVVLTSSVQTVSTWRVSLASLHCLARVRHVVISQWWWCAWVFVFMGVFMIVFGVYFPFQGCSAMLIIFSVGWPILHYIDSWIGNICHLCYSVLVFVF